MANTYTQSQYSDWRAECCNILIRDYLASMIRNLWCVKIRTEVISFEIEFGLRFGEVIYEYSIWHTYLTGILTEFSSANRTSIWYTDACAFEPSLRTSKWTHCHGTPLHCVYIPTKISYRGLSGFATSFPRGLLGRGLTTCPLYVGPFFNPFKISELCWRIIFLSCKYKYIYISCWFGYCFLNCHRRDQYSF